jgi:hypothetical protein
MGPVVQGIAGLVLLVCYILIVVKMFQHNQTILGIVCIVLFCCGLGQLLVLIYGWMKVKEWNMMTLMLVYTGALVIYILGNVVFAPAIDMDQIKKWQGQ